MSTADALTNLEATFRREGLAAALDSLIAELRAGGQYDQLFDALLMRKKAEMGLPLVRPTTFEDVPAARRSEFEQSYIEAAREVGNAFLNQKKLVEAFPYFQAIRDTAPLADALAAAPMPADYDERTEELLNLAFYQGIHPQRGLEIMLKLQGTCSSITALDQAFVQLSSAQRSDCAALLVRTLHRDLLANLQREVRQRLPMTPPAKTVRELIAGRDWLFAESNYHIDVSHLNSVVRFARSISNGRPELALALDLCEYGQRLDAQLQYPAAVPFDDYYEAHLRFFRVLLDEDREASLDYFRQKLAQEPDRPDQALIAYVLVDLLVRVGRTSEAVDLAEEHLVGADAEFRQPFLDLCRESGTWIALQRLAAKEANAVLYLAALAEGGTPRPDSAPAPGLAVSR